MNYSDVKKNLREFLIDFLRHPFHTLGIIFIVLLVYFVFEATREVISAGAVDLFNRNRSTEVVNSDNATANIANYSYTTSTAIQLTPKKLQQETADFKTDIDYPFFNISLLDSEILHLLEEESSKARYENYGGSDPIKRGISGWYDSPYIDPEIISYIQYTCSYYYLGGENIPSRCVEFEHGINFDRSTGRLIKLADALNMIGLTLDELSQEIKNRYPDTANDEIWSDGFIPISDNYSSFLVDNKSVTFLFQRYQLTSGAAGSQHVTFERKR